MFDLKWIRSNPQALDTACQNRSGEPVSAHILTLDEQKRSVQTQAQTAQAERKQLSQIVGMHKKKGEAVPQDVTDKLSALKQTLEHLSDQEEKITQTLNNLLMSLPNAPLPSVPVGANEEGNVLMDEWGAKPTFDFEPKQHFELAEAWGHLDFETAARISGSRFAVLSGPLAKLERALAAFFLDTHTQDYGYTEVIPPFLVKEEAAFGTGQLPKFDEDLFQTTNGYYLIPTAEMPLTNLMREQIIPKSDLPLRYTAYTPCFRSEAGAAGKDTRGLIRQHQFSKVELVSLVEPDQADAEHERMTKLSETLLQKLELPYRKMLLCTGDMGPQSVKTYDLEVWLPGQNAYREIASCSQCGDYQALRMKTRYKGDDDKNHPIHTLNGSALPLGRTIVALLENGQQADGRVQLPEALAPYMGANNLILS
jgi:seryl-tRNA synthetase